MNPTDLGLTFALALRRALAPISWLAAPGIVTCPRCGLSVRHVSFVVLRLRQGHGHFPACEKCWNQLSSKDRVLLVAQLWCRTQKRNGRGDDIHDLSLRVQAAYEDVRLRPTGRL